MNDAVEVHRATLNDIEILAPMFSEYRQFYRQPADIDACAQFLSERFKHEESLAFIATINHQAVGFIHLYPGFSSVYLKPIWTMNDLFVRSIARRKGVGFALLDAAKKMALDSGAILLKLSTEQRNMAAQKVYESKGYRRDNTFHHYILPLKENL
ncbi:GNAT family N-acetyltransferase [Pleionea litopenaei]|uniref:GNAT family N-acetyltransferase n=1 Tax=Pleionea litopenaei TaxID=3070815 RepID=A0AA51RWZ7_9GAMM|nr:GNAT family N-acetyltransferase [Pleionea sp. HL-JVS1]WMS89191.1 GNAT family N-acetyltransferase [Pleionea sp. HL-JVS1]